MGKFIVHIAQDNGHKVIDKINKLYPNGKQVKIADGWYGIKSDKLTDDIAKELGFIVSNDSNKSPAESPAIGLVIRETAISGYYRKNLWEWYNNDD